MADFGVVFDCDGTLLDTMGAWCEVEGGLFERAGVAPTQEDINTLVTLTIPEVGAFYHERFGLGTSAEDVIGMIDAAMIDYYATKAVPRPGALAFVQGLAERGVPMSVASSSPLAHLQIGLEATGFAPYLAAIVSVDDVGASKREPAVYDRACESFGLDRARIWGFEDSLYAVRTLKAAGYRTAAIYDADLAGTFENLSAEAEITVRSFTEFDPARFPGDLLARKR